MPRTVPFWLMLGGLLAYSSGADPHAGVAALATVPSLDRFICGTRPPERFATLAPAPGMADGTAISYAQDPAVLTMDYSGPVTLRSFTVVGDHSTIRIYYYSRQLGTYAFDTFTRVTTTSVNGSLVSVFEPSWNFTDLVLRFQGSFISLSYDRSSINTLYLAMPDSPTAPGLPPSAAQAMNIMLGPTTLVHAPITKVDNAAQYSSNVVNLVIPGFGNTRVSGGEFAFEVSDVARKFYQYFEDSYDFITIVPQEYSFASYSAFHTNVRNAIQGINQPVFDSSASYGSRGVLQGIEVSRISLSHGTMKHEHAHQWGEYFDWAKIAGAQGTDGAHSPLSADRESAISNRTFYWLRVLPTLAGGWQSAVAPAPWRYHPLTLYAMGRMPKEQVPDITVFDDQSQFVSLAGQAVQGTFKRRSIYDVIGVHGDRSGPVVGNTLRQAVVLVSSRGLATQREMDYWNYFAQYIEDPNHTGALAENGDESFDIATGIDLQTDIRPKTGVPTSGDHAVELRPFGVTDIRGLTLDGQFPGEFKAGVETHIVGTALDPSTASIGFYVTVSNFTNQGTSLLSVNAPVGANGRFDAALKFPSQREGVYAMVINLLDKTGNITFVEKLTPITVTGTGCTTPPGAPSGLTGSVSKSLLFLTWQPSVQGCAPTSYVLEAGGRPGSTDIAVNTWSTLTTLAEPNVPDGSYFLRVRARNSSGMGTPSNEIAVVVGSCSNSPAAPSSLTVTVSGSTVTLAWAAASGATTYVVEAGSAPGLSNLASVDLNGASTSYVAAGVGPGTYYVRLRAKGTCGVSGPSNETMIVVR